jgi:hypothetical protein
MSGNLGLEGPNKTAVGQQLMLYPYVNPPDYYGTPAIEAKYPFNGMTSLEPLATLDDGTQIWKITHNGVDTHPIHFHLFDIQLVNRVGWDNIIRKPEPSELGWKDTVRVSPLEDTIVALRPILPKIPWGVPDSKAPPRPVDGPRDERAVQPGRRRRQPGQHSDRQRDLQLQVGIRLALPHPQPRGNGHDAAVCR